MKKCPCCGSLIPEKDDVFAPDGEIYAGVKVMYKGKIYITGNRKYPLVELFEGDKFIKTVYQHEIMVVKK